MISFFDYQKLTPEEQAQTLWQDGVFLELTRQTTRLNVDLYALHNFYVEIYFSRSTEEPLYLKAFAQVKRLEAYFKNINIENLLESRNDELAS